MYRFKLFCLMTILIIPTQVSAKERLAVMDLAAKHGVESSLAQAISVIVRDEMHSYGTYDVLSKEDLSTVAERSKLQQMVGSDDKQCLIEFGRALGTRYMIAGAISKIGSTFSVSLRMLDTEGKNSGVIKREQELCQCSEDELIQTAISVAGKMMESVPHANALEEAAPAQQPIAKAAPMQQPAAEAAPIPQQEPVATTVIAASPASTYIDPQTGMEFVWVEGGCYYMGCGDWQNGCEDDEKPAHRVCLDGYYIGKFEVTQGQWESIMRYNPSASSRGSNYPIENVSWHDVQEYAKKMANLTGKVYRLPTEAEWEYACRSRGAGEKYCGGNIAGDLAWHFSNSQWKTYEVGQKQPNGLGIHDMSGNVWEWINDWKTDYGSVAQDNPEGPLSGEYRVFRGGSWGYGPQRVRSTNRGRYSPEESDADLGFRLVIPGNPQQAVANSQN